LKQKNRAAVPLNEALGKD